MRGSRGNHGTCPEQETHGLGQKLSGASAVTAVPPYTKLSLCFPKHVLDIILALWGQVSRPSYTGFPVMTLARERDLLLVHIICYWLQGNYFLVFIFFFTFFTAGQHNLRKEWKSIYLHTKPEHEEAITMPFGMDLGTH